MRYSILSDVHGQYEKLAFVLSDAQKRDVDCVISLGDVGGDQCLALLWRAGARCVFGNYEVSGWQQLADGHQAWVCSWPPLLIETDFLAVHAAPWWPDGLKNLVDFGEKLRAENWPWRVLFPYLLREDNLWHAFAELEAADKWILFHGHTHRQAIWCWLPSGRLKKMEETEVVVVKGHRYVVGVGSAGWPEDGGWAAYTLYDSDSGLIKLVRYGQ